MLLAKVKLCDKNRPMKCQTQLNNQTYCNAIFHSLNVFLFFLDFNEQHIDTTEKQYGSSKLRPQPRHHGQEADPERAGHGGGASTPDRQR